MEKVTRRIVRWIAGALAAWGVVEFGLTHSYPHGPPLRLGRRSPLGPGQHAREGTVCAGLAGHSPNERTCLSILGHAGETQKPIVHGDVHAGVDQPHRQQRLNEIL